ncbi:putative transcription factor C2H2 family [Helianthus annuus]|nr:putative transcription factor C2H2 family [Helianthus annuus]KAJ0679748.1 putative transcription factor C2H2 family [Helianthus annuus]
MRLLKMRLLSSSSSPPPLNPPTNSKTNETVLFARNIIIVIAFMFFICGLLHLLVKYLIKRKKLLSLSSNSHFQSSRFQETGTTIDDGDGDGDAYQRQLQQLFNLHDCGLDQAFIDALPVFSYKELMGLKEPFDCAVCLCEFTQKDNLRLLPLCSHAFHMQCIDTWLLSNSTCPLCRGALFTPGLENPGFEFGYSREQEDDDDDNVVVVENQGYFGNFKQHEGSICSEKRVYPVRLGKFRATNGGKREEKEVGETSNSNFDARRCYSMGSYEYVVRNLDLKVEFVANSSRGSFGIKEKGHVSIDGGGSDGKKISNRSKGESFSVSKIWLWSKKDHNHQKGQIHCVTPHG